MITCHNLENIDRNLITGIKINILHQNNVIESQLFLFWLLDNFFTYYFGLIQSIFRMIFNQHFREKTHFLLPIIFNLLFDKTIIFHAIYGLDNVGFLLIQKMPLVLIFGSSFSHHQLCFNNFVDIFNISLIICERIKEIICK